MNSLSKRPTVAGWAIALGVAGCGGGGGGAGVTTPPPPPPVVAAPAPAPVPVPAPAPAPAPTPAPAPAPAITITAQPAAASVAWKANTTLSVAATGADLSYQWTLNGIPIRAATGTSLTVDAVAGSDAGDYQVVITNKPGEQLKSSIATLTLTNTDGSGAEKSGRIIVAPVSGDVVQMPAWDKNWQLTYRFVTPKLPSSATWDFQRGVFYIWGDVDFDSYGVNGAYKLSGYLYNQIVPQLMTGYVLSGNDANYAPSWSRLSTWMIQAQYFWQKGTSYFAQTGSLVAVKPGDLLTETISYDAASGAITATISAPGGTSSISIARPFPNEPTLFANWADFFKQAQAVSGGSGVLARPQMNIEPYEVDKQTACSILPFEVKEIGIPGATTFTVGVQQKLPCAKPVQLGF